MAGLERLADRELGGMEALFLKGDAEVASRSTVSALFLFDRELPFADVLLAHDRGSRLAPRFRQRVVAPVVPISRPYWIVDPDFDLRHHVRHQPLPGAGTWRELLDLTERQLQTPLDPARPLWEVTLVSGLEGGRSALLYKVHHAVADGGGGPALFAAFFAEQPGTIDRHLPPAPAVEDVTATELTRQRAGQLPFHLAGSAVGAAGSLARLGGRVVRAPRSTIGHALGYARSARRTLTAGPAPSPLLARRGLRRRVATISGPKQALRSAAKRMDVSLNDAYLAALCGGLGAYHDRLGLPVGTIPLALPVSIRKPDDPIDSNRFVGARIAAPLSIPALDERARRIRELVGQARTEPALTAFTALAPAASMVPMWLTMSLLGGQPADVQASNIPSWTRTQYLGPASLTATYSFGPLAISAVMAVLATYDDDFDLGLNLDTDAVKDPELLVTLIATEFDELIGPGQLEVHA